jgi:hypothetical protein
MFDDIPVADHDAVPPELFRRALTAGELVYPDGAAQIFDAEGGTTYVDGGRPTRGRWYVDENGRFGSFWPPAFRASYDLRWIVEDGAVVGLRFVDPAAGTRFEGRFRGAAPTPRRGGS